MRINYNLLWIEDDDSWFETTKELLDDYIDDLGFILNVRRCNSFEEVQGLTDEDISSFDLMLVDFNLSGSEHGDDVIQNIRDREILTEVIFYSSAVESVRDGMRKHTLEGVYSSDRADINLKFEQVVSLTLRKIQAVNTMRGLIMAETSDLDKIMLDITALLLNNEEHSSKMEEYLTDQVSSTFEKIQSLKEDKKPFIEKISDARLFTSFHKAKSINQYLKITGKKGEQFFNNYNREIISVRNLFAHVTEEAREGQKVLISHFSGQEEEFTEERCIEIRKNLIKYRKKLEQIKLEIEDNTSSS
ncbi:response regulator [Flammeovirga sp. OC4]|uniref:response regulator n=1 Tax=Flammeovirga sp. OC4 TaxID=1382345 RepID=UPI0005C75DC3|nr:response regulator [Flammeovirga sp. OC4]